MNNKSTTFSLAGRLRSSVHAGEGIVEMLRSQHNAWVELVATIGVTAAGWLFGVTAEEEDDSGHHGGDYRKGSKRDKQERGGKRDFKRGFDE